MQILDNWEVAFCRQLVNNVICTLSWHVGTRHSFPILQIFHEHASAEFSLFQMLCCAWRFVTLRDFHPVVWDSVSCVMSVRKNGSHNQCQLLSLGSSTAACKMWFSSWVWTIPPAVKNIRSPNLVCRSLLAPPVWMRHIVFITIYQIVTDIYAMLDATMMGTYAYMKPYKWPGILTLAVAHTACLKGKWNLPIMHLINDVVLHMGRRSFLSPIASTFHLET